ncbi:class I SAM-dependent methyltransferase [Desulfobacter postgatei]|uniref:Methylase involved in ubiquinone/menaquinone biosynthesis n=1 Tax=Desulfobacter postgatei 2ac9 TaxID=879212 RepID=I5B2U1_9BACT|nr:class I SAM-dependent methyltransferase [Desulfobacter postgatei]EIM63804.1 methylase involved in ubiquinone/menaquinone biosynthesis [Desulfobacter postgatei 2ac9]
METVACQLCNSRKYTVQFSAYDYITNEAHVLVRCDNCNFSYVNPQPTVDQLQKYYPESYYGDDQFLYEKIDNFIRFKKIKELFPDTTGTILDIGCGKGLLLKALEDINWKVHGIELSETSALYAKKKLNIKIATQMLDTCNFPSNHFDLVTMFHSLEHMKEPKKILKEIHRVLSDDGILLIEVPKFDSLFSKLFKEKWFHLDLPRHLYHFENFSIKKILKDSGFQIIDHKNFAFFYDIFGNIQSCYNFICSKVNLFNDFNTKRLTIKSIKKFRHRNRIYLDLLFCHLTFPVFFLVMLLLSIVLSLFNQGGTLIILAQKHPTI